MLVLSCHKPMQEPLWEQQQVDPPRVGLPGEVLVHPIAASTSPRNSGVWHAPTPTAHTPGTGDVKFSGGQLLSPAMSP